jgi:AAA15 family ATPase/GTPase
MNAYLHPKLFKAIIEIFNSEENKMNQLIFNSHDIINMTNELFRRDEIWFVYRDEDYSTRLTPLSNIVNYKGEQVRKDAKYFKQYLEGRYGADPFIKKGLGWNE